MKMDKKDHEPLHRARKNIKKVRKSLVTSGFFKKSGDIFFGATSHKNNRFRFENGCFSNFLAKNGVDKNGVGVSFGVSCRNVKNTK